MVMVETPPEGSENFEVIEPSVRRARGRPRKEETVNTENKKPPGADGSAPKEKVKRRKKGQPTSDEIQMRAQMLAGIHFTLAMFTQIPEFQLREEEAMALASASLNAENELGFEINTKAVAVATLIGTMGSIYVPRAIAVGQRMKKERDRKQAEKDLGSAPNAIDPNVPPEFKYAA